MARLGLTRVPLWLIALIVGALAVAVELLGSVAGLGLASIALLVIPAALAAAYVVEYRTLPSEPEPWPDPSDGSATSGDDDFVDPVEEADRLDSADPSWAGEAAPEEPAADATDPAAPETGQSGTT